MKISLNKKTLRNLSQKPLDSNATKNVAGGTIFISGPCTAVQAQRCH